MASLPSHGLVQVSLRTSALGSSVEEAERLIRKHEIFQKVLTAQDEKVMGSGSPGLRQSWWGEGESGTFGDLHRGPRVLGE